MTAEKTKAVELLAQSLQQYVLFSTVLITGLITYLATKNELKKKGMLWTAIVAFGASAALAIANINCLVDDMDQQAVGVSSWLSRGLNMGAILCFVLGVIMGLLFLVNNQGKSGDTKAVGATGMEITDQRISLGTNFSPKVEIKRDANGKITEIKIN